METIKLLEELATNENITIAGDIQQLAEALDKGFAIDSVFHYGVEVRVWLHAGRLCVQ